MLVVLVVLVVMVVLVVLYTEEEEKGRRDCAEEKVRGRWVVYTGLIVVLFFS